MRKSRLLPGGALGISVLLAVVACSPNSESNTLRGNPENVIDRIAESVREGNPALLNAVIASMQVRDEEGTELFTQFLPSPDAGLSVETEVVPDSDQAGADVEFRLRTPDGSLNSFYIRVDQAEDGGNAYNYDLFGDFDSVFFPFGALVEGQRVPAGGYFVMPNGLPETQVSGDSLGWVQLSPPNLTLRQGLDYFRQDVDDWFATAEVTPTGYAGLERLSSSMCSAAENYADQTLDLATEIVDLYGSDPFATEAAWTDCSVNPDRANVRISSLVQGTFSQEFELLPATNEPPQPQVAIYAPIELTGEFIDNGAGRTGGGMEETLTIHVILVRDGNEWIVVDSSEYFFSYTVESELNQQILSFLS